VPKPYDIGTCYHLGVRWVWVLLLVGAAASAAPTVEIRAKTQLSLGHVKLRDNGTIEVTGFLVDKLTGTGIEGERVYVTIGAHTSYDTTAPDGSFHVTIEGAPGPQQVTLAYRGGTNNRIEPADPLSVTTDPAKSQVELAIVKVSDSDRGPVLRVNGVSEDGLTQVPLAIEAASTAKDDWTQVLRTTSNTDFTLTRAQVGGPGLHRIRATFSGDDARQRATAESTVEWTATTTTTISVSSHRIAYEDKLAVAGRVTDEDGKPVARAAVTLLSGDRRLAQGATSQDGTYHFTVEAQIIAGAPTAETGDRQFGVQVSCDPGQSFVTSSKSPPEVIAIRPPQPVPVSYTVIAFLATALAAGGFFAARNKPWRRFRRPAPPAEVPSVDGEVGEAAGGLVVARPGFIPTLRRPSDDTFSGVVRDTVRGRPIAGALVKVGGRDVTTGPDGGFVVEHLPAGELRAEVSAEGHVTEAFTVTIPHRGELRGVRVDLVPVRERVFQLYRRAAEPVLPESRLWGIWTPRQIVDHVRSKRPSPALADLTDFVEEIYFSPRVAAESVLPQAAGRVDRAIQERARR
jgi:hypothetical protein